MAATKALMPSAWGRAMAGLPARMRNLAPGIGLCLAVAFLAMALERAQVILCGRAWLESLVLAILLGTGFRSCRALRRSELDGVDFSARTLLEVAVVLFGASVSGTALLSAGPRLLIGIVGVVVVAIVASYAIGRALGLSRRLAMLVACGNAICGNSAIAATAPVIGAKGEDVASSIAFTAVLGVLVVLGLPLLAPMFGLSNAHYGILAGLTVYAVPQVLAATVPVAALSVQVGTLVKLMRVMMLGPVVLALAIIARRGQCGGGTTPRLPLNRLVPWFVIGFLVMAALRSSGLLAVGWLEPMAVGANLLTVIAMAALGLGVDVRTVARAGIRVTATVVASLLVLGAASLGLIACLPQG